ncbi:uncharacterized protein LOC128557704 [Mercenaria mercenaria]|uniref:uncharacterized protein LOC128557704 n=1 Tax=Mercenaria mercenaria TaxID=6596 RepID=UPI00234F1934|nr:uncharacterized protein LOC128557704 [Mercenaria mercenaria]
METADAKLQSDDIDLTDGEIRKNKNTSSSDTHWNEIAEQSSSNSKESENTPEETGATVKIDKLEKYLEDVYQKHCEFSISEQEIEFIRNGVEKLTLEYLQKIFKHPLCERNSCKVNHFSEIELLKVGSFYEGTRNGYPDEFDFIAVLGSVDEVPSIDRHSHFRTGACAYSGLYQSAEFPDASIRFGFASGILTKINRLEFLYRYGREEITIDIDVVTALRCNNTEKYYCEGGVFNKNFFQEILSTGSFLFIYTGSVTSISSEEDGFRCHDSPWDKTITETEKRFVRDILSKKHRKVYQILKYIINGYFGEDLFKYLDCDSQSERPYPSGSGFCISSYTIKVAIIHHHYKCNNDSKKVGDCVLELLRYLLLPYEHYNRGLVCMHSLLYVDWNGSRIGRGKYAFLGIFYWCLMAFINRLASLKNHSDGLDKCTHDLENSFMEMALRLDIFHNYEQRLSKMNDEYSDKHIYPKICRLLKKLKNYNEKRNAVPDCQWCDYPIVINMAHKRRP